MGAVLLTNNVVQTAEVPIQVMDLPNPEQCRVIFHGMANFFFYF